MPADAHPDREPSAVVVMPPVLLRRRDAAAALAVSESQVMVWERTGLLRPVKLPGLRAVRLFREDVERLAASWRAGVSQEVRR